MIIQGGFADSIVVTSFPWTMETNLQMFGLDVSVQLGLVFVTGFAFGA